jgi:hypothetical protein
LVIINSDGLYNDFVAGVDDYLNCLQLFCYAKAKLPAMGQEEKNFSKVFC